MAKRVDPQRLESWRRKKREAERKKMEMLAFINTYEAKIAEHERAIAKIREDAPKMAQAYEDAVAAIRRYDTWIEANEKSVNVAQQLAKAERELREIEANERYKQAEANRARLGRKGVGNS